MIVQHEHEHKIENVQISVNVIFNFTQKLELSHFHSDVSIKFKSKVTRDLKDKFRPLENFSSFPHDCILSKSF